MLDLVPGADGGVAGVTLHVMGEGQRDGVGAVLCRAVVLASGGLGQVFSATTNPSVSTGDGMALALRAGAVLRDLEFVQFHPTVMWLGAGSTGQQPLISEAVRGEGAFLVDDAGVRFMLGQHELADLAPRDVVAKAIMRRMRETGAEHVWLDARGFGAEKWERRFPTILATCRSHGVDPVTELIPVGARLPLRLRRRRHRPARPVLGDRPVRLRRGGLLRGARRQPAGLQLAARGPGVLPPDRRAPGRRAARRGRSRPATRGRPGWWTATCAPELQHVMTETAGVLRSARRARRRRRRARPLATRTTDVADVAAWESTNLLTVSTALVDAATTARGDPRVALARGLPGARRRALGPARRRHARRRAPRLAPLTRPHRSPRVTSTDTDDTLDRELAEAGLDPRAVSAAVARGRRRGPARRGRHQRRHARPGRDRLGRPRRARATAWWPGWPSPSWCSAPSSAPDVEVRPVGRRRGPGRPAATCCCPCTGRCRPCSPPSGPR